MKLASLAFAVLIASTALGQEKGTRAAYKQANRSQQEIAGAQIGVKPQGPLSEEDKALLDAAIGKISKERHQKYSAASRIDKAVVGSVVCVRRYMNNGKKQFYVVKIERKVDDSNAVATFSMLQYGDAGKPKTFWIKGFDLKDVAVGDKVELDGCYAITGVREKMPVLEPVGSAD